MEKTIERAKRPAPTRPDPKTPATSPGSVLIGVIGGVAGLIRNTIFRRRKASAKKPAPQRPPGRTSPGVRKTASTGKGASTGQAIHVTADPKGGWRAVRSGASRALARSDSKQEVVSRAR